MKNYKIKSSQMSFIADDKRKAGMSPLKQPQLRPITWWGY